MALVNQPPILASSFAVNGDKNTIPTTNSGTEGLASLSLGFPPITQQPVSQGGIPPQRADFNGIFNLITNFLMFLQNGSIFAYSSSLDYQPPAIVYGNNALYRCIDTNGANTSAGVQPLSNTSYWQPLIPVGGITVSGNTITVTNETGTQIRYTIDTITNPPSQSDSSNKIVTSAWVKAYAPSKTGSGASGTWNITATKATQDSEGKAINTTYLKLSGGTMGGALNLANNVLNKLGDDCYFGDQNVSGGFCLKGINGTTNLTFINKDDVSKKASLSYAGGNLISSATIQGNLSGTATKATNADNSTKATQDSQGQQINTTYVKGLSANNATLTVTKGNGSTSTITVNNVSRAEYSDRVGTNAGYSNSTTGSSLKTGISQSAIYNNSFPFSYGNLISIKNSGANQIALEWTGTTGGIGKVAVRCARDASLGTWSAWRYLAYTESPAFSGTPTAPTPSTSDNGTRVATTAFVQSLLTNKFKASKKQNGWWKDGNTGILYQWGAVDITYGVENYDITFPITFNSLFTIVDGGVFDIRIISRSNSGFRIGQRSGDSADIYCYIAIGY